MTQDNQPALSSFMSKESTDRLALGLCEMRGAALKFGKILSIHDESLVPALKYKKDKLENEPVPVAVMAQRSGRLENFGVESRNRGIVEAVVRDTGGDRIFRWRLRDSGGGDEIVGMREDGTFGSDGGELEFSFSLFYFLF
ncbi:hypothetical protein ISN44_As06g039070 [Arabidopsis suecica]|uniref:Uncharacterized protein n=1 Tax=Arabidopsis suecica TaxID=45249 RepID=A0A8T2CYA3_ARASU|nr:hypothetical protein ISN44_As06g039070 [Arabidopsis suecica]